ncbi:MAG: hypothetical protein HOV79_31455 [Hamadaea sp.]|nr:hypothetical protein [Hamadaea sp.]
MAIAVVAAGIVFGWSTPASAARVNWYWTPNKISPLLDFGGGCTFRI